MKALISCHEKHPPKNEDTHVCPGDTHGYLSGHLTKSVCQEAYALGGHVAGLLQETKFFDIC